MSIVLKNVSYTYSGGTPLARQSLRNVDISVSDGEWVVVMGPTGSGKSTLLQHLNGLLKPSLGQVLIDGTDIHSSVSRLKAARQKIGFVFQYPEHQLFGSTVFEEVSYGPVNFGYSESEVEGMVQNALSIVGLSFTDYKDRSPHELSGGEKRRAALAGVLATSPKVIALDEPTAGLDYNGKRRLVETVARLNQERGTTVIWVTHEISEIATLANRLIVLNQGKVVLDGNAREGLYNPLLDELGLDIPLAVRVAKSLKKRGKVIEGHLVTVDEIKGEILRLAR